MNAVLSGQNRQIKTGSMSIAVSATINIDLGGIPKLLAINTGLYSTGSGTGQGFLAQFVVPDVGQKVTPYTGEVITITATGFSYQNSTGAALTRRYFAVM